MENDEKRHSLKPVLMIGFILGVTALYFLTTTLKEKEIDHTKAIKYSLVKEDFLAQVKQMNEDFKVREVDGVAVVHPKPGSNVYVPSGNYKWGSILELEKGKTYHFHVASTDKLMHSIWVDRMQISQKLRKGKVYILTVTPKEVGDFGIICREFCGPQHYAMIGKIIVVD
ncbi:MAG: hypothetical protein Q9M28_07395 [Mariprofundaceae bacterium]|nr:hypothetical protein [Mariprofundaceae bacterium]